MTQTRRLSLRCEREQAAWIQRARAGAALSRDVTGADDLRLNRLRRLAASIDGAPSVEYDGVVGGDATLVSTSPSDDGRRRSTEVLVLVEGVGTLTFPDLARFREAAEAMADYARRFLEPPLTGPSPDDLDLLRVIHETGGAEYHRDDLALDFLDPLLDAGFVTLGPAHGPNLAFRRAELTDAGRTSLADP